MGTGKLGVKEQRSGHARAKCCPGIYEVFQVGDTFLGVPIIKIIIHWGLYCGPPIYGNYHIAADEYMSEVLQNRVFVETTAIPGACRGSERILFTTILSVDSAKSHTGISMRLLTINRGG